MAVLLRQPLLLVCVFGAILGLGHCVLGAVYCGVGRAVVSRLGLTVGGALGAMVV